MLRSMTGFGSAQAVVQGVEYSVEVRSVNNRYFKPAIRLPDFLSPIEAEVEKRLRGAISRGTVSLSVRAKLPQDKAAYRVNTAALAHYIDQLKVLEVEANPTMRIDLGSLLGLPGVCEPPEIDDLCQTTQKGAMLLVDQALGLLVDMRTREGLSLREELLAHCKMLLDQTEAVAARAPQVVADYHKRLTARVAELTSAGTVDIDSDALAREVAIFAERSDVTEEVARLRSHVEQFLAAVDVPSEPSGRKLDFIAQEMLREANTIASKGSDIFIGRQVVDMKTAIDRIKEQVQNVE